VSNENNVLIHAPTPIDESKRYDTVLLQPPIRSSLPTKELRDLNNDPIEVDLALDFRYTGSDRMFR